MELLAPAGSFAALRAAVENGADAVYLGGKSYSARAAATNFSDGELQSAFDYCHIRGVKVYVTVNTLLRDEEIEAALPYLRNLYTWGADGIIVQDLGLAQRLRQEVPKLELHGSTQMTVHNYLDLVPLAELGMKRVVLARELDLRAIETIKKETRLELEVFVHGALCICYSGQCLMSSLIGGRSGNRGQCAQPCRQPYVIPGLTTPGEYVISPKDLALVDELQHLRSAGVTSLKIEGRLKSPDYVGVVVRTYRAALDGKQYRKNDLETVFNRGFTKAYFHGTKNPGLITYTRPLIEDRSGSALETYTSDRAFRKVSAHLWVNAQLGKPLKLILLDQDGVHVEVEGAIAAEAAQKHALDKELLVDKLLRLGNDPLAISDLQLELEPGLYLPVSELNEVRRKLVASWEQARLAPYRKRKISAHSMKRELRNERQISQKVPSLAVTVSDLPSAIAALQGGADLLYFSGQVYRRQPIDWLAELTASWEEAQKYGALVFVHIERITENAVLTGLQSTLQNHKYDGALVGNFGTWELLKNIDPALPIHTDWSFNAFNRDTVEFLGSKGAKCVTASLELRLNQIQTISSQSSTPLSIVAHGPLESMVTKHCIFRDQGCRLQCQSQAPLLLEDRKGFEFPVYFDRWCQMHIFNSRELSLMEHLPQLKESGVSLLRIEGRLKDPVWIKRTVGIYSRGLLGYKVLADEGEYTKGHYFRGVL